MEHFFRAPLHALRVTTAEIANICFPRSRVDEYCRLFTAINAYPAAAAQFLGDYGFAALYADGFHVASNHGTEADAVLVALLDLALVGVENSDTSHFGFNSEVDL